MTRRSRTLAGALALMSPTFVLAKPIAFADGTTVMAEYGAGTMWEAQIFYAPAYNYSVGGGHVEFTSAISPESESVTYARLNYLLHRWNLEEAQANVYVWGSAGGATGNTFSGTQLAVNAGAQADYQTRRVYASPKTDLQKASAFSVRVDTLQLGIAPYKHRWDRHSDRGDTRPRGAGEAVIDSSAALKRNLLLSAATLVGSAGTLVCCVPPAVPS